VVVPVPPGTIIRDDETGELVRDFGNEEGQFRFLTGGNGGWGNVHFKSSVNQAPRRALPGKEGETRRLRVELQVLADIGLVGFPNAGKSSLLERFTNARPKIAPYPFTTKIPNLGVLTLGASRRSEAGERDIIIADIPGLIEGASEGVGLGIQLLKHISRTAGLVFLADLGEDSCIGAFDTLYNELAAFSPELVKKKRLLVGSKTDLEGASGHLAALREKYAPEPVLGISVFSGDGIGELAEAIGALVHSMEETPLGG
jgi:GTP-binding protein